MTNNRLINKLGKFSLDTSGETTIQATLVFCLAVLLGVAIGIPMLSTASKEYAYQKQYGVDPVQTSSVDKAEKPGKRYTVRKTIFDEEK